MDFQNGQIDLSSLPDAGTITWKPVEARYLLVLRLQWMIISVTLLVAVVVLVWLIPSLQRWPVILSVGAGYLLFTVLYFIIQEKSFPPKAYALREHDIMYRHGWLIHSIEVCPFSRVQHCRVHSGPLDRKYKLASLTLYTAASDDGDLKIPGLPGETAIAIREFITKKITADEGTTH